MYIRFFESDVISAKIENPVPSEIKCLPKNISVLLYSGRARTATKLCLLAWAWKILRTWPRKNFGLCSGEFC